jgi:hypothetical protein
LNDVAAPKRSERFTQPRHQWQIIKRIFDHLIAEPSGCSS